MKHVKIILSLLIVVLISMVGVYLVEGITTPIIEERAALEANAALFEIFPDADNLEDVTADHPEDEVVNQIFIMTQNGNQVGIVYKGVIAGYNPGIEFLIGVDTVNDEVAGYKTLSNGETAGLGKDLLAAPAFNEQFVGVPTETMQDNGKGIDLVAGSTAKLTLGGIRKGVSKALVYHAVNFKGMAAPVEETPEQKAERYMNEFFDGATFTDVTSNYEENDLVLEVYEASIGGYVIKGIFNGYVEGSVYMLGIKDSEIVGFGLVTTNETEGIGADLVVADEFAQQFASKAVDTVRENGVDFVAGSTASFTLNGVNESLKEVLGFYNKQIAGIKDTEAPVLTINEAKPTTLEAGTAAPNWGTYVSATDNEDENVIITNDAEGVVDMETAGTYTVTYTAIDASGNTSSVTIEFTVSAEEVEFVLVPVPEAVQPVLAEMDTVSEQFHDELINQDLINGIFTGRDADGNVLSVFYDVSSTNGQYTTTDNRIMVQFDPSNNTIVKVVVYVKTASYYTSEYADNYETGEDLDSPVIAAIWEGVSSTGEVTESDINTVAGTTAVESFPGMIEAIEQAISYQQTNNVGGAE